MITNSQIFNSMITNSNALYSNVNFFVYQINTPQSNLFTTLITIPFSGFHLWNTWVLWWTLSYPGMNIFLMFPLKHLKFLIYYVIICILFMFLQSTRALEHLSYLRILDYVSTVWNPHSQKNILALEKFKIMALVGFV